MDFSGAGWPRVALLAAHSAITARSHHFRQKSVHKKFSGKRVIACNPRYHRTCRPQVGWRGASRPRAAKYTRTEAIVTADSGLSGHCRAGVWPRLPPTDQKVGDSTSFGRTDTVKASPEYLWRGFCRESTIFARTALSETQSPCPEPALSVVKRALPAPSGPRRCRYTECPPRSTSAPVHRAARCRTTPSAAAGNP